MSPVLSHPEIRIKRKNKTKLLSKDDFESLSDTIDKELETQAFPGMNPNNFNRMRKSMVININNYSSSNISPKNAADRSDGFTFKRKLESE